MHSGFCKQSAEGLLTRGRARLLVHLGLTSGFRHSVCFQNSSGMTGLAVAPINLRCSLVRVWLPATGILRIVILPTEWDIRTNRGIRAAASIGMRALPNDSSRFGSSGNLVAIHVARLSLH
jgi:hypothetical protein